MDKYQALGNNLFGFEMFEEILKVVGERKNVMDDQNFRAGVASCESAVARLREEYYNTIKTQLDEQESK
jgi:serine protease inhibitor